jgi:dihydroorotate dehydrogenase (NAD+) catalytic subunit
MDLNRLGGFVTKGISSEEHEGNPTPRIFETASGMLNSIGLQNVGAGQFIREMWPALQKLDTVVIANIWGRTFEDYVEVAKKLASAGIEAMEVNISCPNIKEGGVQFGKDPAMAYRVVSALRKAVSAHLMIKLSPNVSNIAELAKAAEEGGADSLSLINTLHGMSVNIETRKPELGAAFGGLSGPAILPVALYMVYQTACASSLPIVGMGGIFKPEDAIQFFMLGAHAVQVGTYNFINPAGSLEILEGIEAYCHEKNIQSIGELVGSADIPG